MPAQPSHDQPTNDQPAPADGTAADARAAEATGPREVDMVVRRSVNLGAFGWLGGIVGAILAIVLTYAFPEHPDFTRMQVLGFMLVFVTALTVVLFMGIALIINRVIGRERGRATLQRIDEE